MNPAGERFDLKQIAKLFNKILVTMETLEPQAIEWLNAARIERACMSIAGALCTFEISLLYNYIQFGRGMSQTL
jgi:hypothetical protein